jgi:hypothetical protein
LPLGKRLFFLLEQIVESAGDEATLTKRGLGTELASILVVVSAGWLLLKAFSKPVGIRWWYSSGTL